MEDKNPIQVAGRLFGALEYLVDHGSVSLAELAAALDLNKSTAHRIISSLMSGRIRTRGATVPALKSWISQAASCHGST